MDNRLTFTIITVSFNNGQTIGETIESVLGQTYPDVEYWVIDGGSTDGTLQLLEKYGGKIRWLSEPDGGIYDAMNKGISLANGQFIAFLNADDFYASNQVIERVAQALTQNKGAQAAYGDLAYVQAFDTEKIVRYWKAGDYSINDFRLGWMPPHPTFFLTKSAFQQHGGFRNKVLKSAADYELMLRMLYKHRVKAAYCPHLLVKMRTGGESNRNIQNRVRGNKEDRKAWEINGLKAPWYTLYLKPLRKIPQYWLRPRR